jgi:hypothetical protein
MILLKTLLLIVIFLLLAYFHDRIFPKKTEGMLASRTELSKLNQQVDDLIEQAKQEQAKQAQVPTVQAQVPKMKKHLNQTA